MRRLLPAIIAITFVTTAILATTQTDATATEHQGPTATFGTVPPATPWDWSVTVNVCQVVIHPSGRTVSYTDSLGRSGGPIHTPDTVTLDFPDGGWVDASMVRDSGVTETKRFEVQPCPETTTTLHGTTTTTSPTSTTTEGGSTSTSSLPTVSSTSSTIPESTTTTEVPTTSSSVPETVTTTTDPSSSTPSTTVPVDETTSTSVPETTTTIPEIVTDIPDTGINAQKVFWVAVLLVSIGGFIIAVLALRATRQT